MDYLAFAKLRTRRLRFIYSEAIKPFVETRRRIDSHEEPFEDPPGYEDEEPPFLSEWLEAGEAVDFLGQAIASQLSETLDLYLKHWVAELERAAGKVKLHSLGVPASDEPAFKKLSNQGWFGRYREYCRILGVDWSASGCDISLLEELALARNSAQHPPDITSTRVKQTEDYARRFPNGFFADPFELAANASMARPNSRAFFWPPRLEMSEAKLTKAFDEVDRFCEWLDQQHLVRPRFPRARPSE
jgi:hypothetical protein